MLTGKQILDTTMSHIQDNSAPMRAKLLVWLGVLVQKLYSERDWLCLKQTASLTVTDDYIVKPSDFGRILSVSGTDFFLDDRHRLTDREAYEFTDDNAVDPVPVGFEESATLITFRPGATGPVTLRYSMKAATPTDSVTELCWKDNFLPVFERSLLSAYYEYDSDQRGMPSLALDQKELDLLKFDDNRQKPIPKQSSRGYLRNR